jgi:uncharacterized membrane protein
LKKIALQSVIATLLVLGYPLLTYLAINNGISWVFSLLFGALFVRRAMGGGKQALLFVALAMVLFGGAILFQDISAKIIPVLVHISMFIAFYGSLHTESSLIERFARLDFPDMPPEIVTYTRNVTRVWSAFFAINILLCTALAVWAENSLWALYNGGIIYLLLGLMMISEYIWRRIRYPWLEVPPLKQSMINIFKNGRTVWGSK